MYYLLAPVTTSLQRCIKRQAMKTQYITNKQGKKIAVILPIKSYEKMIDDLDELDAIKAYDKINAGKTQFIPAQDMFNAIERKRK